MASECCNRILQENCRNNRNDQMQQKNLGFCELLRSEFFSRIRQLPRGVRQHCYKKKAATVGQNGRVLPPVTFTVFDF